MSHLLSCVILYYPVSVSPCVTIQIGWIKLRILWVTKPYCHIYKCWAQAKNKQPKADESTQGASLILSSNSNLWTLHPTNKYAYKMDIICDIS